MRFAILDVMTFSLLSSVKSFLSPVNNFRTRTTNTFLVPQLHSFRDKRDFSDVTFGYDHQEKDDSNHEEEPKRRSNSRLPSRPRERNQMSKVNSWKERNQNFMEKMDNPFIPGGRDVSWNYNYNNNNKEDFSKNKSFLDLKGTRVFVKNIPSHVTWQSLKDHFGIAGTVVYASISMDRVTGEPKDHGIVEFETKEEAQNAIQIIRDHPLEGAKLYVRADIKAEENKRGPHQPREGTGQQSTTTTTNSSPMEWRCAHEEEDALDLMDPDSLDTIRSMIQTRDSARRNANYVKSDQIREELKEQYGVHVDDRLKMWWVSLDGKNIPESVASTKGDGRWGKLKPWTRISTSPENDALVDSNLIYRLLRQRDLARQEKDFSKADELLEQVLSCGSGDWTIRIHDESRTWRIWTKEQPQKAKYERSETKISSSQGKKSMRDDNMDFDSKIVYDECISLVNKYAPEKVDEIREMLTIFQGREVTILNKLKSRFKVQ
jgi:RNA recognition motif-containing protein